MDILALERLFNAVNNVPIDKFIDVDKLNDEVNKFGERYKKQYLDKLETRVNEAKGQAKDAFNRSGDALGKASKANDWVSKNGAKVLNAASFALSIAGVGLAAGNFLVLKRWSEAVDRNQIVNYLSQDGAFRVLSTTKFRVDKLEVSVNKINQQNKNFDAELKQANSLAERARKLANDGLYESRVKIARLNDIAAQANSNASKALIQNTQIRSSVNATESKVRAVDSKATNALSEASQARAGVRLVDSKATTALTTAQQLPAKVPALAQPAINNAIAPVKAQVQQVKTIADNAIAKNSSQDQRLTNLEQKVTAVTNRPTPNTPTPNTPTPNTPTVNTPTVNQAIVNQALVNSGVFLRLGAVEATAAAAVKIANTPNVDPAGRQALAIGASNTNAINQLTQEIQQLKAPSLLEPRLKAVEAAVRTPTPDPATIKRVEKLEAQEALRKIVDQQANQKLDNLALLAAAIPTLAANAVNNTLSPQIQQLPGATATAVAAAPCNGKGCGGRTAQRVDGIADEVSALRQQMNSLPNTVGNAVNGANLGLNAGQLAILNRIDSTTQGITGKLGSLLPNGGIGGLISRMAQSSAVDKAVQFSTLLVTLHNGFQLSSDLTQSLFSLSSSAINATMRTMGFSTGEDTPIDVGVIINNELQSLLKSIVGAENLAQMNLALASFNRIYQAGANVISEVRNMSDSTRNVLEYTAENTGRIGNALKRDRIVAPDAYADMPEKVTARTGVQRKLDNIIEGIDDVSTGVSALDSVFQEVVSINDSVESYKQATKEFKDSVEQSPIPTVAANLAVKARREAERAASINPESLATVATGASED